MPVEVSIRRDRYAAITEGELNKVVDSLRKDVFDLWYHSADCLEMRPLSPGKSGSIVFSLGVQSHGVEEIPRVLKIGPREILRKEEEYYEQYVAHKLRFTPLLIRATDFAVSSRILEFHFAGMGGPLDTFANMLPESTPAESNHLYWTSTSVLSVVDFIEAVYDVLFNHILGPWFATARPAAEWAGRETFSLLDEYSFDNETLMRQAYEDTRRAASGNGPTFDHVLSVLRRAFEHIGNRYLQSPIHGDLHGNNILVELWHLNRHTPFGKEFPTSIPIVNFHGHIFPWLIDFGQAHLGHTLRDFTKLEREIKHRIFQFTQSALSELEDLLCATSMPGAFTEDLSNDHHRAFHSMQTPEVRHAYRACRSLRRIANAVLQQRAKCTLGTLEYLASILFQTLLIWRFKTEEFTGQRKAALHSITLSVEQMEQLLSPNI